MASAPGLVRLSTEILEAVVVYLNFDDICNLRLTARKASAKASQGVFKARFVTKSVPVSLEGFRLFAAVTQRDWLGCGLENLTIVGDVSTGVDAISESLIHETAELLTSALEHLRDNSRTHRLRSLSLTIKTTAITWSIHGPAGLPTCHRILECASDIARLVAQAIQATAIPIESLDLFSSVERCALNCVRLQALLEAIDRPVLTSLSLAVTGMARGEHQDDEFGLPQCLSCLLAQAPRLEHLDLRWFNLHVGDLSDAEIKDRNFFAGVVALPMPFLTSVALRGIYTTADVLLAFLTRHPQLLHLTLEELHLEQGSFNPVFTLITNQLRLESLYLNDLWGSSLIQFVGAPGESHFPPPGQMTWIDRRGLKAQKKIVYKHFAGRIKGSAMASKWRRRKFELYGPPM